MIYFDQAATSLPKPPGGGLGLLSGGAESGQQRPGAYSSRSGQPAF